MYSDLHIHASLKQLITKRNLWKNIPYWEWYDGKFSKAWSYDQADFSTLRKAKVGLAVTALHPLETLLTKSIVNRIAARTISGFHVKKLRKLYAGNKSYFDVLKSEYELVKSNYSENAENTIGLITDPSQLNKIEDSNILLAIEGAHGLFGDADPETDRGRFEQQLFDNLREIRTWSPPVFYITLTHWTRNYLVDQSWALPIFGILRSSKMIRELYCDRSPSVKPLGRRLISELVNPSNPDDRRILVDLKHTHINARFQVYDILEEFGDTPVVVSHCAVSGMPTKQEAEKVLSFNQNGKKYTEFNPWELNLCDEDIRRIDGLNGIMGLIVDQRLLGCKNKAFTKAIRARLKQHRLDNIKNRIHTVLWVSNLFHIIKVLDKKEAWDRVCLGSDFDGMIDPINSLPTANHLSIFEKEIIDNIDVYYPDNKRYLFGYTIEQALQKVLYQNLVDFVKKNLQ